MLGLVAAPGAAQEQAEAWRAEKCRLYTRAWEMSAPGLALSERFVAAHDAFLASGCTIRGEVCPQSDAEKGLADMLTLMIVMEGAAGSFLPFHCTADG
ncbi:hypothetical protein [Sinisalibacter aestuarii]|uniref:Uncharacterized protein n=1 Tax=Sinisalibacter aestuarii TaxID=2949426 RepID=A0ABQ5LWW8_9RHOB|nr:hypothetical protein [Sinisalibacter aestuarii]GKY89474.1 hypothetical protein STA1M1_33430 [Sinisalibacter aestuarii]